MRHRETGNADFSDFITYTSFLHLSFMLTIHEEPVAVDHRDDFYRTERDICLYDMNRQYEDRDNESNY